MTMLLNPYAVPIDRRPSRAMLVPKIRSAVDQWRAQDYPGATETSKRLLRFWFEHDHKSGKGRKAEEFRFYFCQREAIETLVYLYEVRGMHSMFDLARNFPPEGQFWLDASDDDAFARYVFKMATGSGKTMVMGMAVVWAYCNAVLEPGSQMPRAFLLIAPNVIVYERLKSDFEDGRVFREYPFIPPEFAAHWQMSVVLRDNPSPPSTIGAIYLTNVQRLYDAPTDRAARNETPAMTGVLGAPVRKDAPLTGVALRELITRHDRLLVLNDEGHHLHNDDLEWAKVIGGLHETLAARGGGVLGQLDFTATPKHQNGALFREIVVDYPIAQAVEDGIVKKPILGELSGILDLESTDASVRYRDRLTAGVAKWREMRDAFEGSGKKPVMFVMAENTKAADDIADWLEGQPDFGGHVLTIHTNRSGDVMEGVSNQKDIEQLRDAARQVDSDDNPYRAIVSVLMLREGWDVKNVVVIVPLRPYTAKAAILPEQTLGRGLRRMNIPGSGHDEQVIVIEHEAFRPFWQKELEEEGLEIEWTPVNDIRPNFHSVYVDRSKLEYDIEIPLLTPSLAVAISLEGMALDEVEPLTVSPPKPSMLGNDTFDYRGREMLSLEVVDAHEIDRDFPADTGGYIASVCRLIERECHLTGQFHVLAGLVKEYIETKLFEGPYSMEEEYVRIRLNRSDAKSAVFRAFVRAIRMRSIETRQVRATGETMRVSDTNGFEWSEAGNRMVYPGNKTVFNFAACDNGFEAQFAQFLDMAGDVAAYAKNTRQVHFVLEYQNSQNALRHYYTDFIVRLHNGDHWLVETKGMEDVEVPLKDARARQWCRDMTALTGVQWAYVKVPYSVFHQSTAHDFYELADEARVLQSAG